MVFDFHEASSSGFFLYCYGPKNKKIAVSFIRELQKNKVVLENEYKDKILTVKNGILYVPWYAEIYMKIKKTVTIGLYFSEKMSKNVFTFETPKNDLLEDRIRTIKIILNYILEI